MSNTYPEPAVLSSNPDSPVLMDEPDFSGLMALTEASIRRKLSELKYPDSDFSSSQNEDESDIKIISISENLPVACDKTGSGYDRNGIQEDCQEKPSKPSDSNNIIHEPPVQAKTAISGEQSGNSTGGDGDGQNSIPLMSALDDPELVKIISLGLNTSKTNSDLKQSVKYCGLSVDLPTENKSPESKISAEKVNHDSDINNENESLEPKESPEKVNFNEPIEDLTAEKTSLVSKKSPENELQSDTRGTATGISLPKRLSPETVKYCGLNLETSPPDKIIHSQPSPHSLEDKVVRKINFSADKDQKNTQSESVIESDKAIALTKVNTHESPDISRIEYVEEKLLESNRNSDTENAAVPILTTHNSIAAKNMDPKVIGVNETIQSESTKMNDSMKETLGGVMDTESDKLITQTPPTVKPANEKASGAERDKNQNDDEGALPSRTIQSPLAVSDKEDLETEKGQKEAMSDDDHHELENDLGLIISDVCSATEVVEEEEIQMKNCTEELQNQERSEETSEASDKEPQKEPQIEEFSDDFVQIDVATEKSEKEIITEKESGKTESLHKDSKSFGSNAFSSSDCTSDDVEMVPETEATVTKDDGCDELNFPNSDSEVFAHSNNKEKDTESETVQQTDCQQLNQEKAMSSEQSLKGISITEVVSLDTAGKSKFVTDDPLIHTIPFPDNTELSALESMVMKVTSNKSDKQPSILKTVPDNNSNISTKVIATNLSDTNVSDIISVENISKTQASIASKTDSNEVKVAETSVIPIEDLHTNQSSEDSIKLDPVNSKANVTQEDVNMLTLPEGAPVCDTSVTESSSITEVGEMLMITNVRTISLDEEEKLTNENNENGDHQSLTSVIDDFSEEKDSSFHNNGTNHDKKGHSNGKVTEVVQANMVVPHTPISKNSLEKADETHSDIRTSEISPDPVQKTYSDSSRPRAHTSNSNSSAGFVEISSFATEVSVASSSSGMPVIANTFTIKEEPIDYEPYGMPVSVANSIAKQTVNTRSPAYNIKTGVYGTPTAATRKTVTTQPRRSSSEQFFHAALTRGGIQNFKQTRTNSGHTPSLEGQLVTIRKDTPTGRGKVIPSPLSTPTTNSNIHKTVNGTFQHQRSPFNAVMSPSVGRSRTEHPTTKSTTFSPGQPIQNKSSVSRTSNGYVSTVNSQAGKRYIAGAPVHFARPAAPAAPPAKLALNHKTINIETVGIPVITEMIARKNPVPVYKPPTPPKVVLGSEKTRQTFPCYECGDTFYLTSSLQQHVYRCSMKISYKCEWCKNILNFTNKCQLLGHLRSHMNIDKNQAVPIHIKSDSIEIETNFDDIRPGKEFKWFKLPDNTDLAEPQFVLDISNNNHPSQIIKLCKAHECTECKWNFYKKDNNAKSIHFAPDKNVKPIFCGKCHMYLRNHCGIKAHRRLHEDILKLDFLVCPECGVCYENKPCVIPLFLQHLKTRCFHLSRFSSMKCSKCKSKCSGVDELRHHLTVCVEQYFKCNKCPMALKTFKSFKTHFKQTHQDKKTDKDDSHDEIKAKIIYRCHVCDTLIDDKEFLLSHIEKHLAEHKDQAEDHFHCLQCGLIFFEKKSLSNHYKSSHKSVQKESFCTLCRSMKKDMIEYTQHILDCHVASSFKPRAQICDDCGLVCLDEHRLRIHECHMKNVAFVVQGDNTAIQKEQKTQSPKKGGKEADQKKTPQKKIKIEKNNKKIRNIIPKPACQYDIIPDHLRKICPHCSATYFSNFKRIEHLRSHAANNVFICLYCECMAFKNNAELTDHEVDCALKTNSDKDDPIPKHLSKHCPNCNYVYGGKSKRNYHIKAHRGNQIYICMFCDALNFNDFPELRSHEVVCNALSKTTVESSDKSPSTTKIKLKFSKGKKSKKSSPEQSMQYQMEFKCDECGQLFSRREKLEEHTRLEHGIHPCHLCGLMYESQTSLKKHLLISHEGKKCVYYCWVCRRRRKFFADVANLQKHFTMKHKQKVWDPVKAVPALPGLDTKDKKTTQPAKRRLETTPEKPDTPVKKLRIMSDKGFKCAKCNFMSEERKDFQDHIKEHKTDDTVQCTECGLCFMVIPSLKKHLFMVHKVRDFDAFLKEHDIEDLKEPEDSESDNETVDEVENEKPIVPELESVNSFVEESEEEEDGNPLECKVCYKKFETEHLMKSHMRVHGMAFIKKTRRSLSSSAKKIKLENLDETERTGDAESAKSEKKNGEPHKRKLKLNL